jgi:hypothetical protein
VKALVMAISAVAGLLAGCVQLLGFEDPVARVDAATGDVADANVDASDGVAGPVRLTVFPDGQAVPPQVLVHGPDGELEGRYTPDGEGKVGFDARPGSSVTVKIGRDVFHTWLGVKPADELVLGTPTPAFWVHEVTATLPGAWEGADHYAIVHDCGREVVPDPLAPVTFAVGNTCPRNYVTFTAVALAADETPLALASASAGPFDRDQTLPATAWFWDRAISTTTLTLTGLPATTETIDISARQRGWSLATTLPATGGSVALPVPRLADPPIYEVAVGVGIGDAWKNLTYTRGADSRLDTLVLDVGTSFLPQVTGVVGDFSDPLRPAATWETTGSAALADLATVAINWNSDGRARVWYVRTRPDAMSVRVPLLPADIEGAPTAASRAGPSFVTLFGANYIEGYDRARSVATRPYGSFVEMTSTGR